MIFLLSPGLWKLLILLHLPNLLLQASPLQASPLLVSPPPPQVNPLLANLLLVNLLLVNPLLVNLLPASPPLVNPLQANLLQANQHQVLSSSRYSKKRTTSCLYEPNSSILNLLSIFVNKPTRISKNTLLLDIDLFIILIFFVIVCFYNQGGSWP